MNIIERILKEEMSKGHKIRISCFIEGCQKETLDHLAEKYNLTISEILKIIIDEGLKEIEDRMIPFDPYK